MASKVLPRGAIKGRPSDFVVQELVYNTVADSDPYVVPAPTSGDCSEPSEIKGWNKAGPFTVFAMQKVGIETDVAVREVARQLEVHYSAISFLGIKDKNAITAQLIAVKGEFKPQFTHRNIRLTQLYGQDNQLGKGANWGNRFSIFVRTQIDRLDEDSLALFGEGGRGVLNLYGPQRLGQRGSEQVGRLLLEGDYQQAARLLEQDKLAKEFHRALRDTRDLVAALFHQDFSFGLNFALQKWQSWLWNNLAAELVEQGNVPATLPFWYPRNYIADLYRHLWDPGPERLDTEMAQRLHTHDRNMWLCPTNFSAHRVEDGWHFQFDLESGAYATVILASFFDLRP